MAFRTVVIGGTRARLESAFSPENRGLFLATPGCESHNSWMSGAGALTGSGEDARNFILVVEDDPNDEYLTLRALKKLGHLAKEILVAHDGVEAIDFLFGRGDHADRATAPLPRLVLLDLKLPRMSGIDVLRTLRLDARFAELPVVVFTSSSQDLDVAAAYQFGANSYVPKPVNHDSFMQAVSTVGTYWMVTNVVRG
jgi:two-component system response regulator